MIQVQKGWREKEKAGLARSKRRLVSPEIRAIRAAHLVAAEAAARGTAIDAEVEAVLKAAAQAEQSAPKVEMEDVSAETHAAQAAAEAKDAEADKPTRSKKGK